MMQNDQDLYQKVVEIIPPSSLKVFLAELTANSLSVDELYKWMGNDIIWSLIEQDLGTMQPQDFLQQPLLITMIAKHWPTERKNILDILIEKKAWKVANMLIEFVNPTTFIDPKEVSAYTHLLAHAERQELLKNTKIATNGLRKKI